MSSQKMIVLGLIAIGRRYGFEMEEFIDETEMRRWAQIGTSTIYKTLNDLDREGAIVSKSEKSDKGPLRKSYSLTASGRSQLRARILEALRSDESVYSDRVTALVFTPLLKKAEAVKQLETTVQRITDVDKTLQRSQAKHKDDFIAQAITQYYRDIYSAERNAMRKIILGLVKSSN